MAEPAKKGVDLAVVFGGPKASAKEAPEEDESGGDDELSPDFEAAASEAFPDMAGDRERLLALKRMVMACMDSY